VTITHYDDEEEKERWPLLLSTRDPTVSRLARTISSNPIPDKTLVSQAALLVDFMLKQWEIPEPGLIISVTGGAKHFKLRYPQMRSAFQKCIVSAAITTGDYILFFY
jgi:hypothetical protein